MKILFVTPYLASPPECGAQRRLEGLMRGFSREHEVSVLSLAAPNSRLEPMREYCKTLDTVEHNVLKQGPLSKRLLQFRSLISTRSFEYLHYQLDAFQERINQTIKREPFDIVQVEFAQMGIYEWPRLAKSPVFVLDEHNIEYDIVKRTAQAEGGAVRKIYSALNWRKVRAEEIDTWRRFDGVALTSARDEELLKLDVPNARTVVAPNAVDLEAFFPNDTPIEPNTLLFLGAMDYHPNIEGIEYFLEEVFPEILKRKPDVKVLIVGRNPTKTMLAKQSEHVHFTGYVDDPRTYLDRAAIVIVPLRIGGGTRFKIVEAMAKGKPIVSTSIGAEGLDAKHEEHLLLADSSAEFVMQTCRLLDDAGLASRLGKSGRAFAETRYGWHAVIEKLERFYSSLLEQRGTPQS